MTQPILVPGYITEVTNAARSALIGRLLTPPVVTEADYEKAIQAMAQSMDISKRDALRILTGDL